MTKKILALLLVFVMVFSLAACNSKDVTESTEATATAETTADTTGTEAPLNQIIMGSTTELSGDWLPYFQNNAADYDIWKFTNGQATVDMKFTGEYVVDNTTVKSYEAVDNADGSKTYTWTINEGLKYSDGSPITAKDYVTSALLWSSKVLGDMGCTTDYGYNWLGWKEFSNGEAKEFKGVRLIDEYTFSLTVDPSKLPYFYELPLVSVGPTKLSYWTDDAVEIKDDGNGAYFSDNFTKENYEEKVLAARNGITMPSSGAYMVESYDEAAKVAVLKINPNYPGAWDGQKPSIETIVYKKVLSETALDELATGSVDLLSKMASGDEINAGLDLVDTGNFAYTSYARAGYGKLEFVCDFGPTADVEVRQAIAYLLDRNDFAKAFTGGFGSVVNGPYGEAMWFYQETKAELNEKLNPYAYNLQAAIDLLVKAGYVYDANGADYTTGVRYKKQADGTLMPLIIEWASSEQNAVSDLLVVKLQENPDLATAGIQINQTVMTFTELLNYLYRDASQDAKYGVPTYSMFNLATNYTPRYDLTNTYTTDPELLKQGFNTNFIIDKDLEALANGLVLTSAADRDGFKTKFVDLVVKWNELLPDLPLYSNIYHDFYNAKLKNYNINALVDSTQSLLYAHVGE
ncbi:ABC transporter substrate-binding protein [Fusibacter bizertensis]